jgi:ankyrin repeat protein
LDGTYEKALLGIDKEKWDYAYRLFQCLVVSIRPLRVEELAELFTVQPGTESIPRFNACWRPENAEEFVLSACSTLVAVVNIHGNKVVQFSHFSVREYLTSSRIANSEHVSHFHILQRPAHSLLAGACLSVLLQLHGRINKTTIRNFPLAWYAAEHWVDHAQFEDVSSDVQDGMERLFDRDKPHFAAWIWVYDIDGYSPGYTHNPKPPGASPLYYAALCGFRDIAERLIDKHPQDVNARGGTRVTPLHVAADTKRLNIVLLLLERGADVGSRDLWRVTPLHLASHHGYADIVQSLIAYGAEPNTEKIDRETPLFVASREGRLEAARVLLGHGSNANHSGISAWTPLHIAAENGHEHVVRLLLEYGANPNAQTSNASTPLHIASFQGKIAVVMVLLEYGVYVDARDSEEETPLHDAAKEGHLEVVQLLLDHGADVNAKNEERCAAWHLAAENGHLQVVELFRRHGEDPNEEARYVGTMELDTPGLFY